MSSASARATAIHAIKPDFVKRAAAAHQPQKSVLRASETPRNTARHNAPWAREAADVLRHLSLEGGGDHMVSSSLMVPLMVYSWFTHGTSPKLLNKQRYSVLACMSS